MISAALLFAGLIPSKFFRALGYLNLQNIGIRQYFRHQSEYLIPVISKFWKTSQEIILSAFLRNKDELQIGSDGRCDSPVSIENMNNICIKSQDICHYAI